MISDSILRYGNHSIPMSNTTSSDIFVASCFANFMVAACVRSSILTFFAVITALLCIMKIVKLHTRQHPVWHQYVIFYTASLECTIGGVHWVIVAYAQMDFVLQYLKLIQFLVMAHYYWTLATRALRRERLTKWVLLPLLVCVCIYFTVIAILGIVNVQSPFIECLRPTTDFNDKDMKFNTWIRFFKLGKPSKSWLYMLKPYWIELSAAEFVTVQLFAIAGFYITKRLNEISTLDSVRWTQKRDLWCIVVVFEISAFIGFLYDALLKILGDENTGCSHIFNDKQELYSTIFVVFMVMKLLLPIWVMLFVFQPAPLIMDSDDLIPALSDDGNSAFTSSVDDQQYRQLYHPSDDYSSFRDHSPSPGTPVRTGSNTSIIKRSSSNLDPISEESSSGAAGAKENQKVKSQNIARNKPPTPQDRETPPSQRGKFYI